MFYNDLTACGSGISFHACKWSKKGALSGGMSHNFSGAHDEGGRGFP